MTTTRILHEALNRSVDLVDLDFDDITFGSPVIPARSFDDVEEDDDDIITPQHGATPPSTPSAPFISDRQATIAPSKMGSGPIPIPARQVEEVVNATPEPSFITGGVSLLYYQARKTSMKECKKLVENPAVENPAVDNTPRLT